MNKPIIKRAGAAAAVLAIALPLTMLWEGKRNTTYIDIAGIPTACYGQTGPKVQIGATYSNATCDTWLREELADYYQAISTCIGRDMQPHQAAAFTVFAYNVGKGGACRSTAVRLAKAGRWPEACRAIGMWDKAYNPKTGRTERVQGLANRRAAEIKLCLGEGRDA